MTAALDVRGVEVRIAGHVILDGVDLAVAPGELLALLGPSGCGKTTLLSTVAGFLAPTAGEIAIGGTVVASPAIHRPPERRSVGFVFQSYALWPHLTAIETVAFPLRAVGTPANQARSRAGEILASLGIADLADRLPGDLSGGQQQRVGLARALARDADLYLLDEPTAHLDGSTRIAAEALIATQREARGAAAVYATHDPAEALGLADRVALMRDGRIIQVGTPTEVYERPVDTWAARLTGPVSIVEAPRWSFDDGEGPGTGAVAIRPEWVHLEGSSPATVTAVRFRGSFTDLTLDTEAGPIEARVPGAPPHRRGDAVRWTATRTWRLTS